MPRFPAVAPSTSAPPTPSTRRDVNRVYASLTPNSPQFAQSVVEIDPDSPAVTHSVPLPQSADLVRVTDDGRYLYAVATTAAPPAVYRIDRSSMTLDTTLVPLFSDSEPPEWQRISDFQPIPGSLTVLSPPSPARVSSRAWLLSTTASADRVCRGQPPKGSTEKSPCWSAPAAPT